MSPQRKSLVTEISLVAKNMADIVQGANTTINIPHSEWHVGDMTAHLIISQQIIISVLTGKKNPHVAITKDFIEEANYKLSHEYIAGLNKKFLSNFAQRDGKILAELLLKETKAFLTTIESYSDEHMVDTHFGRINLLTLLGYSLNHYLIHGSTVAKALHKHLPLTYNNTSLVIPFMKVAMVKLYDRKAAKEFNANFIIAIKGSKSFSLMSSPKGLIISKTIPKVVDCSLSMDSLTFFLLSSGNISQWKALFSGKVSVGGRKPWLALKLLTLFKGL